MRIITPPQTEPVTLEEAKLHLRVDGVEEDSLILSLIKTAREYCEDFQNRAYLIQTWELLLDAFPTFPVLPIKIPKPPLKEIITISYIDKDGDYHTIDNCDYIVDTASEPGRIIPAYGKTWPQVILQPIGAVKIRFTTGYDDVTLVPEKIKQAMKLLIGHWYEHREEVNLGVSVSEIPMAAKMLLWQDRVMIV